MDISTEFYHITKELCLSVTTATTNQLSPYSVLNAPCQHFLVGARLLGHQPHSSMNDWLTPLLHCILAPSLTCNAAFCDCLTAGPAEDALLKADS